MLNRLKDLFRPKSVPLRVGLFIQTDVVILCVLSEDGARLVATDSADFSPDTLPKVLADWVASHGLHGAAVNVTLGGSWYEFQQTERPNVPDEELNQALLWSVRELVQIPQTNLLVDYFDFPAQSAGANKVNVICADKERLRVLVDAVLGAGLDLIDISVEELSLSKLTQGGDDAELLLFQRRGDDLHLAILKQNKIYFARRLRGYQGLPDYSEADLAQGTVDNLSLEIQRSMDLFESQLRQAPVKAIRVAIDTPHQDKLVDLISSNFFQAVSKFRIDLADTDDLAIDLLPAVGAALPQGETA